MKRKNKDRPKLKVDSLHVIPCGSSREIDMQKREDIPVISVSNKLRKESLHNTSMKDNIKYRNKIKKTAEQERRAKKEALAKERENVKKLNQKMKNKITTPVKKAG